jgi:hypothetical protein
MQRLTAVGLALAVLVALVLLYQASQNGQTPPDLVVKFQPIDIADITL